MFENLSSRLGATFDRLKGRGALAQDDINEGLREVRVALLEADVALPVVKEFLAQVREGALGEEVVKSVTPGQMVVKIVHDHLVEILGGEGVALDLVAAPPVAVLLAGLQGSGKTTTCAKIARDLRNKEKKKALMASLDVYRPAAQEQLAVLGREAGIATLPIVAHEKPLEITKRALETAAREGFDLVLLDSAGRVHIDDKLMDELANVATLASPKETLLVADAMTGQDAVRVAQSFHDKVTLTGIVLTRIDGDARGGAALSMRAVTGCPIKLLGTGEKLDALEAFHPDRIASRILGQGDVVGLVEKATEVIDQKEAEKMAQKLKKGSFDLEDFAAQLAQISKIGGMDKLMGLMPGIGKIKKQVAEADLDEKLLKRQQAIISSMTPAERRRPEILRASRKKRVAAGSGTTVADVNRLLKQFKDMHRMVKRMGKMEGKRIPTDLLRQSMPGGSLKFP
ncbi:MAG: signal recognition particle protein [Alphaproteobacteria bacterium]|jgi:signal recognition particle subunit SRP54|nr:signal recognition particle protein [Alphaproteobacteria bacterium]MDP6660252.1 signal recognition particle protein [Alphaproteobacteria bacterium]MDP6781594.1 signal recognition particle protein [Alphaproteobacteria bacterium]MDP7044487.1 signal recognition particle protein [Alphaproteobacteria bacterium]HAQ32644.1 signal recognition particle protein [Rhodospirillaceae bacterium]